MTVRLNDVKAGLVEKRRDLLLRPGVGYAGDPGLHRLELLGKPVGLRDHIGERE